MISEKMDLIYSTLQSEGFELSSASYEKDEYHIFYKDGLVLTIDLSTEDIKGAIIDEFQAVDLLYLIGVELK